MEEKKLTVTFVNVGYGEAILLECPDSSKPDGVFTASMRIISAVSCGQPGSPPRRCCGKRCRRIFTDPSGLWTAPWRETSLKANSCRP